MLISLIGLPVSFISSTILLIALPISFLGLAALTLILATSHCQRATRQTAESPTISFSSERDRSEF